MSGKEKEDDDNSLATIGKVVGVVAGTAFAAWGISKLFTAESPSSSISHYNNNKQQPEAIFYEGGGGDTKKWRLPKQGWLKLNTDASCKRSLVPPSVAIGGVFRNDKGLWVVGFARRIQNVPAGRIDLAELCAIKEGLETALMMRWRENIEIESDSQAAIDYLYSGTVPSDDLGRELVEDCQDLIERLSPRSVQWKHIHKDANKVAHKMADFGHGLDSEMPAYPSTAPKEVDLHYRRDLEII